MVAQGRLGASHGSNVSRLWVFDFDWTVVDENSDTWIHRCAPGGALPPAVRDSYVPPDWVGYMNCVLGHLAQQGVTAEDLRAQLQVIPWTPGMRQLLEAIADSQSPDGSCEAPDGSCEAPGNTASEPASSASGPATSSASPTAAASPSAAAAAANSGLPRSTAAAAAAGAAPGTTPLGAVASTADAAGSPRTAAAAAREGDEGAVAAGAGAAAGAAGAAAGSPAPDTTIPGPSAVVGTPPDADGLGTQAEAPGPAGQGAAGADAGAGAAAPAGDGAAAPGGLPPCASAAQRRPASLRLRGAQHAIILSDANSLFIPWILDDGGGAGGRSHDGDGRGSAGAGAGAAAAATATTIGSALKALEDDSPTGESTDLATTSACGANATPGQGVQRPLSPAFLRVLTNPARVDPASGAVVVSPHNGTGPYSAAPPHSCPRCHPNLCKRAALRRFLDEQAAAGVSYGQIVYIGDGRNDLCPCLALKHGDVAMPRIGFALHKLLGPLAVQAAGPRADDVGAGAGVEGGDASESSTGKASAAAGGSGSATAAAAQQGDDHVYGSSSSSTAGGSEGSGPARVEDDRRVLRAACVPWGDAYDILRWARRQDEQDELAESAAGMAL